MSYPIIAIEGLAGSGKTTTGKLLAEKLQGVYFHCGDNNPLFTYRKYFDRSPVVIMFLFYLIFFHLTYFRAKLLARKSLILQDKSIAYTMSLCRGLGLPKLFYKLVPSYLLNYFTIRLYFDLPCEIRKQRTELRFKDGGKMSINDNRSFDLNDIIEKEYKSIFPSNLTIYNVNNKTPQELAALLFKDLSKMVIKVNPEIKSPILKDQGS